jgi:hypothetical protein
LERQGEIKAHLNLLQRRGLNKTMLLRTLSPWRGRGEAKTTLSLAEGRVRQNKAQ